MSRIKHRGFIQQDQVLSDITAAYRKTGLITTRLNTGKQLYGFDDVSFAKEHGQFVGSKCA